MNSRVHLTAFPAGCNGTATGWLITQDGREIALFLNEEWASLVADACAHRASLLGVLASRPCTHDPVTIQPKIGERLGRLAQICRCCFAFRKRVGCTWGEWQESKPDVEPVTFPDDGPAVMVPYGEEPIGFLIHESEA